MFYNFNKANINNKEYLFFGCSEKMEIIIKNKVYNINNYTF